MFTLGMATYDDFDGVFFTVQSARIHHPEITEIVIIDNNPGTEHSKEIKNLLNWKNDKCALKYIPYSYKKSTSVKNQIFQYASNEYVIAVDCHVLFFPDSIKSLKEYYLNSHKPFDFIQGPMVYDDIKTFSTHLDPVWRGDFYGTWATKKTDEKYFEIPSMGQGCFSSKKNEWLGYNHLFKGFGGEEAYIHEKYRQHGGRCICLQGFKWLHRFGRPRGTPYPNTLEDRYFNYFIGRFELGLGYKDIIEYSIKSSLGKEKAKNVFIQAYNAFYNIHPMYNLGEDFNSLFN